jgi:hypothetical protein
MNTDSKWFLIFGCMLVGVLIVVGVINSIGEAPVLEPTQEEILRGRVDSLGADIKVLMLTDYIQQAVYVTGDSLFHYAPIEPYNCLWIDEAYVDTIIVTRGGIPVALFITGQERHAWIELMKSPFHDKQLVGL